MVIRNDYGSLDRIRNNGYASYSSLSALWTGSDNPLTGDEPFLKFGNELHSRFLERSVVDTLTPSEEELLARMLSRLDKHPQVQMLMRNVLIEQRVDGMLGNFLPFLGYIDIQHTKYLADLKSTQCTTLKPFVESLDFLQPLLYLQMTKLKDFWYIGISKQNCSVLLFNVREYPAKMKEAELKLKTLLKYVKTNL